MGEILVLSATSLEQQVLQERVEDVVRQVVVGREWVRGKIAGREVLLVETGIGAVNTAHALTCVLQAVRPDWVLQLGIGGAYPGSGLAIGDVALASEECYGDLGVRTGDGWQGAELIGIPVLEKGERYFNRFPLDREWLQKAASILPDAKVGAFVTVQECSGTDALGIERGERFAAVCENMEGAAAAHLCVLYEVPFVEVRAMSNRVEARNRDTWDVPLALGEAQVVATRLLEEGL